MKAISILAQKGGSGKTTLALHWTIAAEAAGLGPVVLIDTDPQGSASGWYERRESDLPLLVQVGVHGPNLETALEACRENDVALVIIDTAPHAEQSAAEAARASDIVVIPCRPSILDITAIGATVEIIEAVRIPAVIVLNACMPRSSTTDEAREALKAYGLPICPVDIVQRVALQHALNDGRAVQEFEPQGKAADEIQNSFNWVWRQIDG